MSSSGHVLQRGDVPVHMCLPNGTSNELMAIQKGLGRFCWSATIVNSGDLAVI